MEELFLKRIIESNIFNEKEIKTIKADNLLYEKCYLLGVLDIISSKKEKLGVVPSKEYPKLNDSSGKS